MTASWIEPETWTLPSPDRLAGLIRSWRDRIREAPRQAPAAWSFSTEVSPLDLYCYLKARFGPPNGLMMMLRSPSVDNFCHWNYTLAVPDTVIDVLGLNLRTEIRLYDIPSRSDLPWSDLEAKLREAFQDRQSELQAVRDTLERWHLFINPYRRLTAIVDRFATRLAQLDLSSVTIPAFPTNPAEFPAYRAEFEAAQEKYTEAMSLSLCLQMIAPVMGEAAVNLLMLLLAKLELKADRRLYEDFSRRNIDVRIKSLPLSCVGFEGSIDGTEEPFKNFLRLMNRRNEARLSSTSGRDRTIFR